MTHFIHSSFIITLLNLQPLPLVSSSSLFFQFDFIYFSVDKSLNEVSQTREGLCPTTDSKRLEDKIKYITRGVIRPLSLQGDLIKTLFLLRFGSLQTVDHDVFKEPFRGNQLAPRHATQVGVAAARVEAPCCHFQACGKGISFLLTGFCAGEFFLYIHLGVIHNFNHYHYRTNRTRGVGGRETRHSLF